MDCGRSQKSFALMYRRILGVVLMTVTAGYNLLGAEILAKIDRIANEDGRRFHFRQ